MSDDDEFFELLNRVQPVIALQPPKVTLEDLAKRVDEIEEILASIRTSIPAPKMMAMTKKRKIK